MLTIIKVDGKIKSIFVTEREAKDLAVWIRRMHANLDIESHSAQGTELNNLLYDITKEL